jgi:Spy/CpxP family protein refolding chaperone
MLRNGRLARIAVFAATLLLAISQAAVAQPEEGRRERGGPGGRRFAGGFQSMLRLTMNERVRDVLKLSDEQKAKIDDLAEQFRNDMGKFLNDRGSPEEMQKLREETTVKLADVLDVGQRKRLQEISIQAWGAGAVLADPALAKELKVTDEQKSKLQEIQQSAVRDGFREVRDLSGDERRAKSEELRAKYDKMLLDVLTPGQQQTLDSLKGEKVDIDMSELRGPGRGFRDGRGRGERGERERGDRDRDDSDGDKSA